MKEEYRWEGRLAPCGMSTRTQDMLTFGQTSSLRGQNSESNYPRIVEQAQVHCCVLLRGPCGFPPANSRTCTPALLHRLLQLFRTGGFVILRRKPLQVHSAPDMNHVRTCMPASMVFSLDSMSPFPLPQADVLKTAEGVFSCSPWRLVMWLPLPPYP